MKIKDLPEETNLGDIIVKTPDGIIGRWVSQWGYENGKAGVWLRCDEKSNKITPIILDTLEEVLEWEVIIMTDQLISLETAKLAKEKGFSWDNGIIEIDKRMFPNLPDKIKRLPTQSLLQKWLREKHDIHIIVKVFWNSKTNNRTYAADIYKIGDKPIMRKRDDVLISNWFKVELTYEESLEQALQEALKLL